MELRHGYKQTEVGVIPEDWELQGLLEFAKIANGQVDPRNQPYRSMVLVAPDHVESGTGRLRGKRTAVEQRAISGKYLFEPGDVVYSKIRPYLRKAILADFAGLCSADMYPLRPIEGACGGYLLPVLLADRFSKYAESVSVRSGMPKINRIELADFAIPVPPPLEQRAIATVLSDVDALIAGLERLIAKKRDIKLAAMQQLLTGQTRLPGFYEKWEVKCLGELADIRSGGTPSTSDAAAWDGEIPWCTPTDITGLDGNKYLANTTRKITAHGLKISSAEVIPAGSVVMTSRATIGECAINTVPVATNQGFKNFVPFDWVDGEFLYYLLSTQKQGFISLCGGSTFLEIGKNQLRAYELYFPSSTTEQAAIATVLSDMDANLFALQFRLAKTRALKQGMMQELLTGRTRLV